MVIKKGGRNVEVGEYAACAIIGNRHARLVFVDVRRLPRVLVSVCGIRRAKSTLGFYLVSEAGPLQMVHEVKQKELSSSPDLPLLSSRFFFSPPRYASPRIPIPPSVFPFVSAKSRNPSSFSSSPLFVVLVFFFFFIFVAPLVVLRNGRLTFRRIYLPRDFIV